MSQVTPSKLALATVCPPSLALPEIREVAGIPAERGSIIHAYLYAARTGSPATALESVPLRYYAICAAIDVKALVEMLGDYQAEVAFAWRASTDRARILGRNVDRDYGALEADEIPGSLDACRFDPETKTLYIADWKTGFSWIEHPYSNPQLRAYALMAARAFGAVRVVVLIVVFDEDGKPRTMRAEFDEMDLDGIAHEVRSTIIAVDALRRRAASGPAGRILSSEVTLGEHCRYCPAIFNCPGIAVAATALVEQAEGNEPLTEESLGRAWVVVTAVLAAAEKVKKILRPMVADLIDRTGEPFPLPNGKMVKRIEYTVDEIDLVRAARLAIETSGTAAPLMQQASLSKAGVVRAFEGNEDEAAAFIERLRMRGGVTAEAREKIQAVNQPKPKR